MPEEAHHRKTTDSVLPPAVADRLRLREYRSPLEAVPANRINDFLTQFGALHQRTYEESLRRLEGDILRADPVQLLASLATYLTVRLGGSDFEVTLDRGALPFHVEFVQALALRRPQTEYDWGPAVRPEVFERVLDGVLDIAEAWKNSAFARVGGASGEQARLRMMAQARIRLHTTAVRNWGFPDQMVRVITDLFGPLDGAIEDALGLRATGLLRMLQSVTALVDERCNALMLPMARVFQAGTVPDLVVAYHRELPGSNDDPSAMAAILRNLGAGLDETKSLLLTHLTMFYPGIYTLSADDLAACYPGDVDRRALIAAVGAWSHAFGDLAGADPADLFVSNPVWARPFVALEDGTFFCPNAGLLHSFALGMIEGILVEQAKRDKQSPLVKRYEKRCARFLESEVEALFRRHFPSARVFAGSQWRDAAGAEGENDLLVVLDEHAIVVESKSGKITDEALGGAPRRLKSTVEKLVVDPARQGHRFAALLRDDPAVHRFATDARRTNVVDASEIRRFVVLGVTLELFGLLGLRWPTLAEAGLLPPGVEPTPTLSLVDQEILLDVLPSETRLLHYLTRRADLERRTHIWGDELDLLAHYLHTGFNLGAPEFADDCLIDLSLQSKLIDAVYPLPATERPCDWPGLRLAPLWRQLLADLEGRKPRGWTTVALRLLGVQFPEQRRFAEDLGTIATKTRRASGPRVVRTTRIKVGPKERRLELVGVAFKGYSEGGAEAYVAELKAKHDRGAGPESVTVYLRVEDGRRLLLAA